MAHGDFFHDSSESVSDNSDLTIDPTSAATNGAEIHSIIHGGKVYVYEGTDALFSGTFNEMNTRTLDGSGISQQNKIEIAYDTSDNENTRLRIYNVSGSSIFISVTGVEISN